MTRDEERLLERRLSNPVHVTEWRTDCGALQAEIVEDDTGRKYLKRKCKKCSCGEDEVFHYIELKP